MVVLGIGSLFTGLLGLFLILIGADPQSAFLVTLGVVLVAWMVYGFGELVLGCYAVVQGIYTSFERRAARMRRLARCGTPIGAESGADVDLEMPGGRDMLGL